MSIAEADGWKPKSKSKDVDVVREMVESELAELSRVERVYVQGYLDGMASVLPPGVMLTDDDTFDAINSADECAATHPDWFAIMRLVVPSSRAQVNAEEVHSLDSIPSLGTVMTHVQHEGTFTVIGSKHEGTGRGYSVKVLDEAGDEHHYRAHRLVAVG